MRRKPNLISPIILIAIGVLFLLNNFGLLPWGVWELVWRFWPLVLILVGLEILIGWSRSGIAIALVLSLGLLLILGCLLAAIYWGYPERGIERESMVQEMGDVEEAAIEIELAAGDLIIGSLTDSPNLMEGWYRYRGDGLGVSKTFEVLDGKGRLRLESRRGAFSWPFRGPGDRWDIALTPQIPLALSIETGIGGAALDLRDLQVMSLDLNVGVGSVNVVFPASAGLTIAMVDGGVGDLTLEIPSNVAAMIKVDLGIGSLDIDEGRFPKSGDRYISSDFATAENRLELEVDGGIGRISVR